jgi:hypothetical protein
VIGVAAGMQDSVEARTKPSSMIKADKATGLAPDTARSFTVPQTASLPISPPRKNSGLTT